MHKLSLVSGINFSINSLHKGTASHVRHSSGHPAILFAVFGIGWYLIISKPEKYPSSKTFSDSAKDDTNRKMPSACRGRSARSISSTNKAAGVTINRNKNAMAMNPILGYDHRFLRKKGPDLEVPEHTSNINKVCNGRHLPSLLRTMLAYCLLQMGGQQKH